MSVYDNYVSGLMKRLSVIAIIAVVAIGGFLIWSNRMYHSIYNTGVYLEAETIEKQVTSEQFRKLDNSSVVSADGMVKITLAKGKYLGSAQVYRVYINNKEMVPTYSPIVSKDMWDIYDVAADSYKLAQAKE
jgi:hypothetical protein